MKEHMLQMKAAIADITAVCILMDMIKPDKKDFPSGNSAAELPSKQRRTRNKLSFHNIVFCLKH